MKENRPQKNKSKNLPKLTPAMRVGLRAKIADRADKDPEFRKKVVEMAEAKKQQQSEPQYLNEAHRKSEEAKGKYLASLNPSEIDWEQEKERQKRNARND